MPLYLVFSRLTERGRDRIKHDLDRIMKVNIEIEAPDNAHMSRLAIDLRRTRDERDRDTPGRTDRYVHRIDEGRVTVTRSAGPSQECAAARPPGAGNGSERRSAGAAHRAFCP